MSGKLVERTFRFASWQISKLRAGFSSRHMCRSADAGPILWRRAGREPEGSLYRWRHAGREAFDNLRASPKGSLYLLVIGVLFALLACGCGYHTSGTAVRLPSDLRTIYVPTIINNSQTYRVGQTLTEAVVRELRNRTNYRIVTVNDGEADATLAGNVTGVFIAPLTYDSITGRISSSMVGIGISVSLTSKSGKVLWSNPNFLYREQYQESIDARTFFEEAGPAVQRIANSFAKTLVADMLEAF